MTVKRRPMMSDEERIARAEARVREDPSGKRCPGCKRALTRSSFGSDRNRRDGLYAYCKSCFCTQYLRNKAKNQQKCREFHRTARQDVLDAYGRVCRCCGETREQFLAVDHVNNDGAQHRKAIGGGSRLSLWLRKNGYPEGFQILCHNCNLAKGFYGCCPHVAERDA